VRSDESAERLADDADRGRDERAQVERHRPVGDPFQVVGELLGHRGLVAVPHLREAGEPGPDDEPLPVGGKLAGELLEEARADRARPDEAHVAADDVPELRQLVELSRAKPAAEARGLLASALDQLGAEVGAKAFLGAPAQGAELEHLEDVSAPAHARPAVEEGRAAREQEPQADQQQKRQRDDEEERREQDVEQAELEVDAALRGPVGSLGELLDERVARPRLRRGGRALARLRRSHPVMLERPASPRINRARPLVLTTASV